MYYYYHGIKTTPHPLPSLHHIFYKYCVSTYMSLYMYIPNFMKPAWHNCINKYVWQTFLCKDKIFKKHILFLETTII